MKALKTLDEVRVAYRKHDCDVKLKKVRSQKINPSVERSYNMGDPVIFRDSKKKEWKHGTALVKFGKTLYLKFGNWLRRVPIDTVMPDPMGAEKVEESFIEPADEEEERFKEEEVPVIDLEKDLEVAIEQNTLLDKVKALEEELEKEKMQNAKPSNDDEVIVEESSDSKDASKQDIVQKRAERRKKQNLKKTQHKIILPTHGQHISFKEYDSDIWKKAKVSGVFKKTSIHKNIKQLTFQDGFQTEVDFMNNVEDWKPIDRHEEQSETFVTETDLLSSIVEYGDDDGVFDAFPVNMVPRSQYGSRDVQDAMLKEIEKYKSFKAFEEIDDNGQESLPVRWVVTRHDMDGKNQPLKARMCIRGDLEKGKDDVRSDSPTVGKDTLKLALTIAANESFTVKSGDIKSAYLQGLDLQRQILVKPPPQAGVTNKLWLLKKGAYGISDGGRLFNLRLVKELKDLGMHQVHADGTLFSYVKEDKLHGLIVSHVDDLLIMGDAKFESEIEKRLSNTFIFSKIEEKSFKYCGCQITVEKTGDILLDQIRYVDMIEEIDKKHGDDYRDLTKAELKQLRGKIGEVLWISLMTRPDLAFDINKIATEVQGATVRTVKDMNIIIKKAKARKQVLRFTKLGDYSDLIVKVYTDASYNNQDGKTRSTEGKVVLVENPNTGLSNVVSWKVKKIPRVCRSVKSAETRALEDGLDDAVHTARLVHETYKGAINLKEPEQIPVIAKTDSKSLWESIYNSRQCEEKMLRNTIAGIKELLQLKMLDSVDWVSTEDQLADCLTKKGTVNKANWLLGVLSSNTLKKERESRGRNISYSKQ